MVKYSKLVENVKRVQSTSTAVPRGTISTVAEQVIYLTEVIRGLSDDKLNFNGIIAKIEKDIVLNASKAASLKYYINAAEFAKSGPTDGKLAYTDGNKQGDKALLLYNAGKVDRFATFTEMQEFLVNNYYNKSDVDAIEAGIMSNIATKADKSLANVNLNHFKAKIHASGALSGGSHIPHYLNEAERDQHIPHPTIGQVAYVGIDGSWAIHGFEHTTTGDRWVIGQTSTHQVSSGVSESWVRGKLLLQKNEIDKKASKDLKVNDGNGLVDIETMDGGNDFKTIASMRKLRDMVEPMSTVAQQASIDVFTLKAGKADKKTTYTKIESDNKFEPRLAQVPMVFHMDDGSRITIRGIADV